MVHDLNWKSEYELGVEEFDAQHRYFLALIRKLDLLRKNENKESIVALLDEFLRYSRIHIAHEKAAMEEYSYPQRSDHYIEHAVLISQLLELKEMYKEGVKDSAKVLMFLFQWFNNHTTEADVEVIHFIRDARQKFLK